MSDFLIPYTGPNTLGGVKLVSAAELPTQGICWAIYGFPGVGKSSLAAQAAKSKYGAPVLFVDMEGGSTVVKDLPNIQVAQVNSWQQVTSLNNALLQTPADKLPFKTIVWDNMSELQSISIRGICGKEQPTQPNWGQSTREILYFVTQQRELAQRTGINVIFIAWASYDKEEATGLIKFNMGFTPSLASQFPGIIDVVAELKIDSDAKSTRIINLQAGARTAAKFRRAVTSHAMKIPLQLYYTTEEPMVDILNTIKGGEDFPVSKYIKKAV